MSHVYDQSYSLLKTLPDSLSKAERIKALRNHTNYSTDQAFRIVTLMNLETEISEAEEPADFRKALLNVVIAIKEGTIL